VPSPGSADTWSCAASAPIAGYTGVTISANQTEKLAKITRISPVMSDHALLENLIPMRTLGRSSPWRRAYMGLDQEKQPQLMTT
jgi:hypothetical protein